MKDREISGKSQNVCCFECISFAILFGLFSHRFVNSSQASHFAKQNFKHKVQMGKGKKSQISSRSFKQSHSTENGKDVMICNEISCARD